MAVNDVSTFFLSFFISLSQFVKCLGKQEFNNKIIAVNDVHEPLFYLFIYLFILRDKTVYVLQKLQSWVKESGFLDVHFPGWFPCFSSQSLFSPQTPLLVQCVL